MVYSYDGPGFRQEVIDSAGYERMLPRIAHVLPDTSLIGQLLLGKSVPRVVKSAASGIVQHDGFTWLVHRNRFVDAKMTALGEMIGKTMGEWLGQMDDETRKFFANTVFSLLGSTGADSFSVMSGQKWKSAEAMLAAMRSMPKENQQELLHILGQLGQSGGQVTADYLSARFNKKNEDA